ncbi:hypothetical protein RND81_04G130700 [Saponaria officinalis]|uniref:GIR1-like zinc ribbon domain-containing protein n=1 Tax=Saponaria officinalis TaxID=3572 RepID=A0AAW1LLJ2_SAPOF
MSFQLKTLFPQSKPDLFSCDHINHDGVLVSTLIPITLDLFDTKPSSPRLEFINDFSNRKKQQKRTLDDHNYCEETMNKKNGDIPILDLRLNLSPPISRVTNEAESPSQSTSISPTNSCVSSETSSPKGSTMVLVGCPRCLMYVMLSQDDPKCPKCNNSLLIDFLHDYHNNTRCFKRSRNS